MLDTNKAIHQVSGDVMGGPWQLRHVPIVGVHSDDVAKAALAALQLVDHEMSTYKAESTLMQLNDAPMGEWVEISQDMHTVM